MIKTLGYKKTICISGTIALFAMNLVVAGCGTTGNTTSTPKAAENPQSQVQSASIAIHNTRSDRAITTLQLAVANAQNTANLAATSPIQAGETKTYSVDYCGGFTYVVASSAGGAKLGASNVPCGGSTTIEF